MVAFGGYTQLIDHRTRISVHNYYGAMPKCMSVQSQSIGKLCVTTLSDGSLSTQRGGCEGMKTFCFDNMLMCAHGVHLEISEQGTTQH